MAMDVGMATKSERPPGGPPVTLLLSHSTLTVQSPPRGGLHQDRRHAQTNGRRAGNDEKRDPHGALFHLIFPDQHRSSTREAKGMFPS